MGERGAPHSSLALSLRRCGALDSSACCGLHALTNSELRASTAAVGVLAGHLILSIVNAYANAYACICIPSWHLVSRCSCIHAIPGRAAHLRLRTHLTSLCLCSCLCFVLDPSIPIHLPTDLTLAASPVADQADGALAHSTVAQSSRLDLTRTFLSQSHTCLRRRNLEGTPSDAHSREVTHKHA